MSRTLAPDELHIHKTIASKVDLEEMESVESVSVIAMNMRHSIVSPAVYKIKGTDSLLIFGSIGNSIDLRELQKMYENSVKSSETEEHAGLYSSIGDNLQKEDEQKPEEVPVEVDNERLSEEDIKLISQQVKASRSEIIRALAESDYDVVNAMIKLTK
ncbi:Gal4 DNA-binding enhancer-like protein [Encephalitozoon intestinalis ATCC 50506]|uniref:Gal4 DNA-binding enhancer-like protein n=1 Tax=Encephalitozoon intestinalis (strain ATCC 50506) TaxID=876142 RepID=E0S5W3_ENCIT|nr:Gal4 DNA-binding enhancer-like protein [Encephalitozoon intestinalis ATCC 50506]ADM11098.1 Gal4 DNA-binding enhancer-like protein [Encephalitozoon intestinalis ATCC 50506]UTX44752.1 hypothetical protein GPK93_02g02720 [Encephalitozoon intestinalis]